MKKTIDWAAVQQHYNAGNGRDACARRFGFTIGAWYKAIRFGRLRAHVERRLVDWAEVQRWYDTGRSYRDCKDRFGFAAASWTKAVRRGDVKPRPLALPLDVILRRSRVRCTIKRRLLQAGILENRCDECSITEWRGKPLSIQIDHINGVRDDHRVENLRMLCPNCHSQTPTFAARNRRKPNPR